MNPATKSRIAGALYDFMGYLSTREGDFVYGASHECATDLLNHFEAWCHERGLFPVDLEPEISTWNIGESIVEVFLEFYGTGRLPMRAPGAGSPRAGARYVDTADLTGREKKRWKDGRPDNENFGMAGAPGGRDDPESPSSYIDIPQT